MNSVSRLLIAFRARTLASSSQRSALLIMFTCIRDTATRFVPTGGAYVQGGSHVKVMIILDGLLLSVRGGLPPAALWRVSGSDVCSLRWLAASAAAGLTTVLGSAVSRSGLMEVLAFPPGLVLHVVPSDGEFGWRLWSRPRAGAVLRSSSRAFDRS